MKIYSSPSIEVVKYEMVDIVTASTGEFNWSGWIDDLSL